MKSFVCYNIRKEKFGESFIFNKDYMYYFVNSKGQQQGPVAVNDMRRYGINENTLVWKAGMTQWVKAGDVDELKHLFMPSPPPISPERRQPVGGLDYGMTGNSSDVYQPGGRQGYQGVRSKSFLDHVMTCLKEKYATFDGRATRSEYWYLYLFYVLACIAAYIVFAILGLVFSGGDEDGVFIGGIIGVMLMALALFCPMLSAGVRRLHDTGKSGLWYLICFVPYVGSIVLLVFFCLAGDAHDNQYGPVSNNMKV